MLDKILICKLLKTATHLQSLKRNKPQAECKMSFKKIDKEFLLSDSSVNCYGFRLLTSGYQMSEFAKNPIGFYMHDRDCGVLVKWEDLRVEGDSVFGKPVINMSHERGQQTCDEIEDGFLNAASVGNLVVLEYSDDPTLRLPNQSGFTVTKWFNRECSLVDIPGNFNALKLFDENENELQLSDLAGKNFTQINQISNSMKTIVLTAGLLATLNLKAETPDEDALKSLENLAAKASQADALKIELENLKASVDKDKVTSILKTALSEGRITQEASTELESQFATNPIGLQNLVSKLPVYNPITSQIGNNNSQDFSDLKGKSWDELMELGVIPDLKAKAPDLYKEAFKKEFGKEPKAE